MAGDVVVLAGPPDDRYAPSSSNRAVQVLGLKLSSVDVGWWSTIRLPCGNTNRSRVSEITTSMPLASIGPLATTTDGGWLGSVSRNRKCCVPERGEAEAVPPATTLTVTAVVAASAASLFIIIYLPVALLRRLSYHVRRAARAVAPAGQ